MLLTNCVCFVAKQIKHMTISFTSIQGTILHTTTNINFKIHGNVKFTESSIGKFIHLKGSNTYLQLNPTGVNTCLSDINTCSAGFTVTLKVIFHTLTDNTYIISNGGNSNGYSGISLFYSKDALNFYVKTSTNLWVLTVKHKLTLNVWHAITLSWNKNIGSEILDNGVLIGSASKPSPISQQPTQTIPITIGSGNTDQQTSIDFQISEIQIFDANQGVLNQLLSCEFSSSCCLCSHEH